MDTLDKAENNVLSLTDAEKQSLISGKDVVLGMDGNSLQLAPQAYFAAQAGSLVISNSSAYNSSSMKYAVDNGLSYIDAIGIVIGEVPLAYGQKFELSGGNL